MVDDFVEAGPVGLVESLAYLGLGAAVAYPGDEEGEEGYADGDVGEPREFFELDQLRNVQ